MKFLAFFFIAVLLVGGIDGGNLKIEEKLDPICCLGTLNCATYCVLNGCQSGVCSDGTLCGATCTCSGCPGK
uniref:Uncharacterized protein n=1 Tax=Acrobeloides nanus TaxID=290746 RepID=A0A914CN70_9BILA